MAVAKAGGGLGEIPTVRQGFDPQTVRQYLATYEANAEEALERAEKYRKEMDRLKVELESARRETTDAQAKVMVVGDVLVVAQRAAGDIRARAEAEAASVVQAAREEAAEILRDAGGRAQEVTHSAADRVRALEQEERAARLRAENAARELVETANRLRIAASRLSEPESELEVGE